MTLRKVKGNFERLFDKNQSDLVRGLRNNKNNEHKYITQCIEEIKEELKQDNLSVKANAIAKLTYLQMLGYDISWAAFNMIEVMSSVKFTHKRIGYLCASQCFHENIDVMMLTTNMIRKDLHSQSMYDAGLALSGLACFVNNDIARDLFNDVLMQLNSTKPYLRKKAVLTIYKIFLKYPDALKIAFPRLKEKLEDPDPGVQSAAVNVICELARKNPKNYLCLAPIFFKLMQNSTNNWMLIKIIKLFGALTPLEPRLGKKLIAPLTNLIHSTTAMSLLYECINTVIAVLISISSGLPDHNSSIKLCVQKLGVLIEDTDQNLKYLGLLAMARILKTHPKTVQSHKDLILSCLEDKDESIRLRALDLIIGMISKKNLIEIIHRLMQSIKNSSLGNKYRDELIFKIIEICSQNDYSFISNFEWYISVLVDLSQVEGGTMHSSLIARQLFDVTIRVESITEFSTQQMSIMIENAHVFTDFCDVLYAAAFICGEFSCYLKNKKQVCLNLLNKKFDFPPYIQATFLQNSLKIFVKYIENEKVENLIGLCDDINILLKPFLLSDDFEVQERAATYQQLLNFIREEYIHKLNNNYTKISNEEMQNSSKKNIVNDSVSSTNDLVNSINNLVDTTNDLVDTNNDLVIANNNLESTNNDLDNINLVSSNDLINSTNNIENLTNDFTQIKDELQDFNLESIVFAYSIKPVAAKAQKKVPIPADLDLDIPFHEFENSDHEEEHKKEFGSDSDLFNKNESDIEETNKVKKKKKRSKHKKDKNDPKLNDENIENFQKEENPMYLKSKPKRKDKNKDKIVEEVEVLEAEEAINCELESNKVTIPGLVSYDKYFKENKLSKTSKTKKKDKKRSKSDKEETSKELDGSALEDEKKIKILGLEMPEGIELVNDNDDIDDDNDNEDPHKALANVTFDEFIEEEKALKALNEVTIQEKNKISKSKIKEENGYENKERRKKKSKKETDDKKKKSKKSKSKNEEKKKKKNNDLENVGLNENNIENVEA